LLHGGSFRKADVDLRPVVRPVVDAIIRRADGER
jgi:hypothetical protein